MATTPCYIRANGLYHVGYNYGPCGDATSDSPFASCCSPGDLCLQKGLCQYTHQDEASSGTGSGYYTGGCTDPTLGDINVCPSQCSYTGQGWTDVMFNYTEDAWHCCTFVDAVRDCGIGVESVTFDQLAPGLLRPTASVMDQSRFVAIGTPSNAANASIFTTQTGSLTTVSATTTTLAMVTVTTTASGVATATATIITYMPGHKTSIGAWAGLGICAGLTAISFIAMLVLMGKYRQLKREYRATLRLAPQKDSHSQTRLFHLKSASQTPLEDAPYELASFPDHDLGGGWKVDLLELGSPTGR